MTGRSRMLQLRSRDGFCLDQLTWKMAATMTAQHHAIPETQGTLVVAQLCAQRDGGLSAERINVLRRERG